MKSSIGAIWLCILPAISLAYQMPSNKTQGTIKWGGSVQTIDVKPISFAEIEITAETTSHKIESDSDGNFAVVLPTGKIMLRISANGFCSRTVDVLANSGVKTVSKFTLMACSDCPRMNVDFDEPAFGGDAGPAPSVDYSKLSSMKYEKELISFSRSAELQFNMAYGKRSEQHNSVLYEGLFCPGYDKPAILQYRDVSISAQQFIYSREAQTIRGEGDIV